MTKKTKKRLLDALHKSSGTKGIPQSVQNTFKRMHEIARQTSPQPQSVVNGVPLTAKQLADHMNLIHRLSGLPEDFTAEEIAGKLDAAFGEKDETVWGGMHIRRITGHSPDAGKYVISNI